MYITKINFKKQRKEDLYNGENNNNMLYDFALQHPCMWGYPLIV